MPASCLCHCPLTKARDGSSIEWAGRLDGTALAIRLRQASHGK